MRRFKWLCIASLAVFAVSYTLDSGMNQIQENLFVEAGMDDTYEKDDIYYAYFESAKLQRDLARIEEKKAHQTWSFEQYKKF